MSTSDDVSETEKEVQIGMDVAQTETNNEESGEDKAADEDEAKDTNSNSPPPVVPFAHEHRQRMQQTIMSVLQSPLTNQNEALNVMVGLLSIAQWNGAFTMDLAAKAYEAIKLFTAAQPNTESEE